MILLFIISFFAGCFLGAFALFCYVAYRELKR